MAVKCNIPGLALQQIQGMLYGFNCNDVTFKVAENYMEWLHCPYVEHQNCKEFPCIPPEGDIICSVDTVNLQIANITHNSVLVIFNPPTQPYVVTIFDVDAQQTILTYNQPDSPIQLTILSNDTDYLAILTLNCAGGETKQVQAPFHTLPICVNILSITGTPEDIPDII